MKMTLEVKLHYFGNVQGVGFRVHVKQLADRFHIKGTVRNRSDGSVEVIGQGTKENLHSFIREIKGHFGPGHLKDVQSEFYSPQKSFEDFCIIH